ncbi:MAG: ParB/RepB/Spo0J family partition protein, partial [Candidatus Andersenbacteria bacterium]
LEGEGYELIAGERRLRASKLLNWDKVPAVVRMDVNSDQSRLVFALIENIQRQNLNPVEEAQAYMKLNQEYGLTHEEIGERVGKSRVGITNILRILQLPAEIQRGLTEGKITIGHAKAILMIPDEEKQIRFYHHLLDEGLTVRKAEIRARRIQRSMKLNDPLRQNRRRQHPLASRYSPVLEERYGYNALVKFNETKNRFEVTFRAFSEQEVEELVGRLLGTAELPDHDPDIMEGEDEEDEDEGE